MRFYSDNTATVCPEILAAIVAANHGHSIGYGDDEWTQRLDAAFTGFFGTEVKVFVVVTGTAANALSLATLAPPFGEVYAHMHAHVIAHECGATSFFSNGATLTGVSGSDGKLNPETLGAALSSHPVSVHTLQPAAVSLTQATEVGTAYQPDEVAAIASLAHSRGLKVHMDGARFANAVEFLGCSPADVTWRAGVDVLSFGATKNGALAADAIVFFNPALARDVEVRRKRAGHLISKSRFVAAQLLAYLEDDLWRRNAARANSLARRIGEAARTAPAVTLLHPSETNQLFLHLGESGKKKLRDAGFEFYDWGSETSGNARFVVSWDQREEEVDALCSALLALER